jgi:hypothetical protein
MDSPLDIYNCKLAEIVLEDNMVGKVLKLTLNNIHDQKLTLRHPKSGKEYKYVFIPVKEAAPSRTTPKLYAQSRGMVFSRFHARPPA